MKFFFDRQISVHIARMIGNFDRKNTIVHQDDDVRFDIDDTDAHILKILASEEPKPIWITADVAQKRKPDERVALRDSGMTVFFFKGFFKNKNPHFQSLKVLSIWPRIAELSEPPMYLLHSRFHLVV